MPGEHIIHIVPQFLPQKDGAGEYAFNLAGALRTSYGIESQFIACNPDRDGPSRVDGFIVQRLRVQNEAGIWNLLSSSKRPASAVVLHYCPYGYDKKGLPLWLYRGIKSWLEEGAGASPVNDKNLVTVFYNSLQTPLKPWNKEFCLRMPQRWLLQQFHRYSKFSMTKNHHVQFPQDDVAVGKIKLLMTSESQPDSPTKSPDWGLTARRFYEALHQVSPDAATAAPSGKKEGGAKPARPANDSELNMAEHQAG